MGRLYLQNVNVIYQRVTPRTIIYAELVFIGFLLLRLIWDEADKSQWDLTLPMSTHSCVYLCYYVYFVRVVPDNSKLNLNQKLNKLLFHSFTKRIIPQKQFTNQKIFVETMFSSVPFENT